MKDIPEYDAAIHELLDGVEKRTGSKIENLNILDQKENGLVFVATFENGKVLAGHITAEDFGGRLQLRCRANFL